MGEFKLLPPAAVFDLAQCLKTAELTGAWPEQLREMLYLQLPSKDEARDAGRRRPIALLPQVYRLWSAACKQDVKQGQTCRARGEVPVAVGEGALDETFDLAFKTEARNASRQHQTALNLNSLPLRGLVHALNCALNIYSGSRRILIQGAVSDAVQSTCGLPPGCGLAVDLLHAFLIHTLQSAGRQVEVRKYVDDMVLVASGPYFAHYLRDSYRDVIKALRQANMQVNPKKTVIICNGTHTKNKLTRAWRAGLFPPAHVRITTRTRDLGVDTQWTSWRNPVQQLPKENTHL
eukprot:230580-Amphidinium_carterae.1